MQAGCSSPRYKEQSRHTHEHEQGNQYRTTRKPLPRTTTTGQAKKGWLVSNPLRADIGTTANTAKSASTFQKAALTIRLTTLEEEAVTPCTRDYVATNGWLSKGCNRLTSGTARNPCFTKAQQMHAQRALNAKNGRNRNERDERVTPAELPPSVENAAEREETLKAQAGSNAGITSQWHLKLY
jgi:hypothetical protein